MEKVTEELKKNGLEKYSALLKGILSFIKCITSCFIKYYFYSLLLYGFNDKNFTGRQRYKTCTDQMCIYLYVYYLIYLSYLFFFSV